MKSRNMKVSTTQRGSMTKRASMAEGSRVIHSTVDLGKVYMVAAEDYLCHRGKWFLRVLGKSNFLFNRRERREDAKFAEFFL